MPNRARWEADTPMVALCRDPDSAGGHITPPLPIVVEKSPLHQLPKPWAKHSLFVGQRALIGERSQKSALRLRLPRLGYSKQDKPIPTARN